MKKARRKIKRIFSVLMSLVLALNLIGFIERGVLVQEVHAVTTNQQHIVDRADYMYNSTWVCQKTISGWNYKYTFYAGNTYRLPYAWPVHAGAYIGYGISVEDFLAAAANGSHKFYTTRSYVSGVSYSYSTYYGSDCSSFVSWCWGLSRNTTYTIPNHSTYIGETTTNNCTWNLQLGDALNDYDSHVVLVTDLQYNSSGAITQIEITEQTPPQMKRSYYSPSALAAKYGGKYQIYRYKGTVPAAPYAKPKLEGSPLRLEDSFTATIKSVVADKNLAVETDGNVVIKDKAVDTAQQWKFTRKSDGGYEIKNVKTGKCLDVAASSSKEGANVQVWDALNNAAQTWYIYLCNGKYVLRPGCSQETVLDVAGSGTASGTNVATWSYIENGKAQQFEISHVLPTELANLGDSFTAKITNKGTGKNLSIYEPNNAVIYEDSTSPAQRWNFVRQSDGSYEITNLKYGKCLDVSGGSASAGANVQIWDDLNNSAQRWFIYSVGNEYIFRPACAFDCVLDVNGGFSENNTNVQMWSYNSGNAQKFTIKKLYYKNGYEAGYKGGMAGDGKIYAHGLDLSSWQGTGVDFAAIKNAGYSYVILRAGTTKGKDTCFDTLYTNAKAAGLNVGAYYYSYALTVDEAKKDAENMLTWIQGKLFEYPVYFDYEDASQKALSADLSKNICLAFMDRLAGAGYLTGMYTGAYFSEQLPMSTICAKYEFWVAHYYDYTYQSKNDTYCKTSGMYQYTDRNYVNGAGPFDGNVCYKDYPTIVKKYGFNGYVSEVLEEVPALTTEPVNIGDDFYAFITNVGANKNISVTDKENVAIYQAASDDAQKWHFVRQENGSYEITNVKYNKPLDAQTGLGKAGDNVALWDDIDSTAQRWFIHSSGNGYVLRPACSELCVLDVAGSATENNSNVHIWTYLGGNAQKFTISKTLPPTIVNIGDSFTAKIVGTVSGKNLAIQSTEPAEGKGPNVVIHQDSVTPDQQWKFTRQADGSYEIKNVQYNKCLDVDTGQDGSGLNIHLWDDLDNTAQRWFIYEVNGHYVFKPACTTNAVMDIYDASDADDTNIQTWTYHGGEAQQFDVEKIEPKDYLIDWGDGFTAKITNVNSLKSLALQDDSNVVIYTENTDDSQKWVFEKQSDGSYMIKNAVHGMYLEVADAKVTEGANVQIGKKSDSKGQRWFIYRLGSGQYVFKPACTENSVMDVAGSGTDDNTNVATWTYNGCRAQIFKITRTVPADEQNLGETFEAKIKNNASKKYVSVNSEGNAVQYESSDSYAQDWKFVRQTDGSYEITNLKYNKCLDVNDASAESGANVQVWDDLNNNAQRWFIYKVNGAYVLNPACAPGCVLDVNGGTDENNANIQSWEFIASDAQLFTIEKKVVEEPTTQKPLDEETTTKKPAQQETTTKKPVEQETTEKPSEEETTTKKPSGEQETTEKPSEEETTTKKPSGEQPSEEETTKPSQVVNACKPEILQKPVKAIYSCGDKAIALEVKAEATDDGELSYQWYKNTRMNTKGGTLIPNATKSSYVPDTKKVGAYYYYCIVTNTNVKVNGKQSAIRNSGYAKVQVKKLSNKITNVSSAYVKNVNSSPFKLSTKANGTIMYKSSNTKVAVVASDGTVKVIGIGTAYITISASSDVYAYATKRVKVKVVPATVKLTTIASNAKKALSVKWEKMTGISGFKIQYSETKDFKNVKTSYVGSLRHSKTRSDLSAGKKYYVRVCAYKKIGKTSYYGEWSTSKYCTVKK